MLFKLQFLYVVIFKAFARSCQPKTNVFGLKIHFYIFFRDRFGQPEIGYFNIKVSFFQIDIFEKLNFFFFVKIHQKGCLSVEMNHDILQFKISMDDEFINASFVSFSYLLHDLLNYYLWDVPILCIKYIFKASSIAKFHYKP